MKLIDMSDEYRRSERRISRRIEELGKLTQNSRDDSELAQLRYRIRILTAMKKEAGELAVLTKRYYERGYHRNEKYTFHK